MPGQDRHDGPAEPEADDAVVARAREVGVDQLVARVGGRDGEAEQAALAGVGVDAGHAHHHALAPARAGDPDDPAGGALGHQGVAVASREEVDAPRDLQAAGDRRDLGGAGGLGAAGGGRER